MRPPHPRSRITGPRAYAKTDKLAIRQLGKPNKIWYDNRRMSWDFEINRRVGASVFFECLNGLMKPCTQLSVYWSGTAVWDPKDDVDALGLRVSPICSYTPTIAMGGELKATGIKAASDKWSMEIYEHPSNGSWRLIGWSRAKDGDPDKGCGLANGMGRSYVAEKWYTSLFENRPGGR